MRTPAGTGTQIRVELRSGPTVTIENPAGLTVDVEESLVRKGNLRVSTKARHLRVSWDDERELLSVDGFSPPARERRVWFFDMADVQDFTVS